MYIPSLHPETPLPCLPENTLFLHPGLPGIAPHRMFHHPDAYPFTEREAQAVLTELLNLGEMLHGADTPGILGSVERAQRYSAGISHLTHSEKTALYRFGLCGSLDAAAPSLEKQEEFQHKVMAHKALLLAWDLEGRLMEISALESEIEAAGEKLAALLADDGDGGKRRNLSASFGNLPDPVHVADWRLALMAGAAFLPEECSLFSAHPHMAQALCDTNLPRPLPQGAAGLLCGLTAEQLEATVYIQAPLWSLAGCRRPPENRPWLLRAPSLFVYAPRQTRIAHDR